MGYAKYREGETVLLFLKRWGESPRELLHTPHRGGNAICYIREGVVEGPLGDRPLEEYVELITEAMKSQPPTASHAEVASDVGKATPTSTLNPGLQKPSASPTGAAGYTGLPTDILRRAKRYLPFEPHRLVSAARILNPLTDRAGRNRDPHVVTHLWRLRFEGGGDAQSDKAEAVVMLPERPGRPILAERDPYSAYYSAVVRFSRPKNSIESNDHAVQAAVSCVPWPAKAERAAEKRGDGTWQVTLFGNTGDEKADAHRMARVRLLPADGVAEVRYPIIK